MFGKLRKLFVFGARDQRAHRSGTVRKCKPRRGPLQLESLEQRDVPSTVAFGDVTQILGIHNESVVLRVNGDGSTTMFINKVDRGTDTSGKIFLNTNGGTNTFAVVMDTGAATNDALITTTAFNQQAVKIALPNPLKSPTFILNDEGYVTKSLTMQADATNIVDIVNSANNLDGIGGWTVVGDGPGTHLSVIDAGASRNNLSRYTISGDQVTFDASRNVPGRSIVTYSSVGTLSLSGSATSDLVNVTGVAPGTSVFVNGGAGNDLFNISSDQGSLAPVLGQVSVNGGGGADTLVLRDTNTTIPQNYTVKSSSVTWSNPLGINYSNVGKLFLLGTFAGAVYNVDSTSAATHLNTGVGNDTINIGNGNLGLVQGQVTVVNFGGNDTIDLDDRNGVFKGNYSFTADRSDFGTAELTRNGFGGLIYAGFFHGTISGAPQSLTLYGANAGAEYDVSASVVPTMLIGGTGNDTFKIGTGQLAALTSHVRVVGGGGVNSVIVSDANGTANETYRIASNTVTGTGFAGVDYSAVQSLTLYGGLGRDVYNVVNTSVATKIEDDAGRNTFNLGAETGSLAGLVGRLTLKGSGADALVFYDTANPKDETYTFSGAPGELKTEAVDVLFSQMKAVFLETNGHGTVIDPSHKILVDALPLG
jgi:hypothetical protein